nr:hypothetical protein [Micromonospora sp. DSM 115978]
MNDCTLPTRRESGPCCRLGVIQIEDLTGDRAWACPRHALYALHGIEGARIVRDLRTEPNGEQQ